MDGDARAHARARTGPENRAAPWDGSAPLRLGERWALGADDLQWIVLRARTHRGGIKWQPIAFVRSTKAVLARVLRINGAILSADGAAALNALQPTYEAWRSAVGHGGEGGDGL